MLNEQIENVKTEFKSNFGYDLLADYNSDNIIACGDAFIVLGENESEIIDIITLNERKESIIEIINCYILSLKKTERISIIFLYPKRQLIKQILLCLSVKSISIEKNCLCIVVNTNRTLYKETELTDVTKKCLIENSKNVSRFLRKTHCRISDKLIGVREKPLVGLANKQEGVVAGSLGPFPEFILPTFPCQKTTQGFCCPCFFSKISIGNGTNQQILDSFVSQTEYIVQNFDELVMQCQMRTDSVMKALWDVTLCFATNGSIFSNIESTRTGRLKAFRLLSDEIEKRQLRPLVYIETCVDDYLKLLASNELIDLLPYFKKLNVVILCGFESIQDFTRDVLYTKSLLLSDFEEVVKQNKLLGLQTGAFLYTGFHSMTQQEIIIDFTVSLTYLAELDAVPVIMIPKLHEFTLPDILYQYDRYNIIDPITVLTISQITAWMLDKDRNTLSKDIWLMSDLLDDIPSSRITFYNNKKNSTCFNCSETVRKKIQAVRATTDSSYLRKAWNSILSCRNHCNEKYLDILDREDQIRKEVSLVERTEQNINFALEQMAEYVLKQKIEMARKELLCYGLNLDEETLDKIRAKNEYFGIEKKVHVGHLQLPDKSFVNAPVQEEFSKMSPYTIKVKNDGHLILFKGDEEFFNITIPTPPRWYAKNTIDGKSMSSIINVHGRCTLALVHHHNCRYKQQGKGCKFCSSDHWLGTEIGNIATPEQIVEVTRAAYSENGNYSLALSGGSKEPPGRGASHFAKIARMVKVVVPDIEISVELAPPDDNCEIDKLISAGVSTIIINLEFYDDEIRKHWCPGKFEITKERYFEVLSYAVSKLGKGKVSSVLIAGIEDVKSTIEGARRLIDIGVIPTIMPFRPYDLCEMNYKKYGKTTNPEILFEIERDLKNYVFKKGYIYSCSHGCLNCNACIGVSVLNADK